MLQNIPRLENSRSEGYTIGAARRFTMKKILQAIGLIGLMFVASCSIKQSITLDKERRATIKMDYSVSPTVADTMMSLMSLNSDSGSAPKALFKVEDIQNGFKKNPHITLKSISAPTKTSLKVEFVYDDFEQAFKSDDIKKTGLVKFDTAGNQTTVLIHIAKDTISQIAAIFPEDQRSYLDIFSPPAVEGTQMTEPEYLDMLKSLFGDAVVPEAKKATIELTFSPSGKIVGQKGGTMKNGSVVFTIPLLKVLVLDKPLDYSITYQD
jgi:hypothetical protein